MANKRAYTFGQGQMQTQEQMQKMTTRQVQYMRLLEMPLAQMEEMVGSELNDNIALVKDGSVDFDDSITEKISNGRESTSLDFPEDNSSEGEELDKDLEQTVDSNEDDSSEEKSNDTDSSDISFGLLDDPNDERGPKMEISPDDSETLYQQLEEQIQMLDLEDDEIELMEYIIGQLDNNGFLGKDPIIMAEELILFQGKDVAPEAIERLVKLLKTLDPAGIGAKDLQECLLIQVGRRNKSAVTAVMKRILRDFFPDFINQRWRALYRGIDEDEELIDEALQKIRKLNPRPGADLGDNVKVSAQQIVPDFIVETNGNKVNFSLNYGKIPRLVVDADWDDLVKKYEGVDKEKMRKELYEEYMWKRNRVKRAHLFIQLLQLRFHTLYMTMKCIVEHQKQFFLTGDDNDLKPFSLKDIADVMKVDVSTVSRACQSKYVQTEWGIFPLKHFFLLSYGEGDEHYTLKQIYSALQEIIDNEDKHKPLSDDSISKLMKEKGFDLARRTVAKHRENLGIPVKRLRKISN